MMHCLASLTHLLNSLLGAENRHIVGQSLTNLFNGYDAGLGL